MCGWVSLFLRGSLLKGDFCFLGIVVRFLCLQNFNARASEFRLSDTPTTRQTCLIAKVHIYVEDHVEELISQHQLFVCSILILEDKFHCQKDEHSLHNEPIVERFSQF